LNFRWVALKIIQEILRDKRTLAFFVLVPIVVMTLIYFALVEDDIPGIGVVSRGTARLFDSEIVAVLEDDEDVEVVPLNIPDEETDPLVLKEMMYKALLSREVDGILYLDENLLIERFGGGRGVLYVFVEGSRPIVTATVFSAIASAMDDLAASLPVVIDSSCSAMCADSVNNETMDLEKHFIYGSDDLRLTDFFLPVFPTFFVFFFTFLISTISFQRERLRGTLERLLVAPISFYEIVLGYVAGFFIFVTVQASIILSYILVLIQFELSVTQIVSISFVVLLTMLIALMLGLLASFMSANEFQALQFIPLVILPQIFLSDMIWDIQNFPKVFQWISYIFPLTHANHVARDVMIRNNSLMNSLPQIFILCGFVVLILGVMTAVARHKQKTN
jgi:ABC-2 type transport system permease protein